MAGPLTLRCRTKLGQHILKDMASDSTMLDLKVLIVSVTGFEFHCLELKTGYPPVTIIAEDESLVCSCGIKSGDTIIVEEIANGSTIAQKCKTHAITNNTGKYTNSSDSALKRKVVPANNSCLFTSIDFCLNGGVKVDQSAAPPMRKVVAEKILSDSEKYSEALLGKSPEDYSKWILKPDSWGGAIELSILCQHYNTEIDVVDVQHTRTEKFGEGNQRKILLIYDGIHYDPLYVEGKPNQTIFSVDDEMITAQGLSIAEQEKANRQFTDPRRFHLRCLACNKGFIGALEAQKHAEESQHVNFGEY